MKDIITRIFERELKRLDDKSETGELDNNDVRKLEGLVKAYANFLNKPADEPPKNDSPEEIPTDELLNEVTPANEQRQE